MERSNYSESSSDTETESGGEGEESEELEDDSGEIEIPPPCVQKKGPRSLEQILMDCEAAEAKSNKGNLVKLQKEETKPIIKSEKKPPSRSSLLTGRGVTTQMLIEEQILEAGEKCLSINYLGKKFIGDLNPDGRIKCLSSKQVFSSPSAWAMHCKKQVNPDKKSGCGWASVKYKGRKLDEFKSNWFRKQKISQTVAASSENDSTPVKCEEPCQSSFVMESGTDQYKQEQIYNVPESKELIESKSPLTPPSKGSMKCVPFKSPNPNDVVKSEVYVPPTSNYLTFSEALEAVHRTQSMNVMCKMGNRSSTPKMMAGHYSRRPLKGSGMEYHPSTAYNPPPMKFPQKKPTRTRISVKHSLIQPNSDCTTLVECVQFQSTGKIQPFSISISTSTLLLIDFHCHLTTTEVSGYLAGKWDVSRQHLRASVAYPCKYDHMSASIQQIERIENEIQSDIESEGMVLLGWYHSHPFCQPDPSLNDIQAQLEYQLSVKDGHYEPCVGLIISPFDSYKKESQINAFWVRRPPDGNFNQVGLPLSVRYTTHQDQTLNQKVVNEMVALVNYYSGTSEVVKFSESWSADSTYMDKLKHSVIRKFPQDQTDGRFLEFIHKMLMGACG